MNARTGIILMCVGGCWTTPFGCGNKVAPSPEEEGQVGSIVQTAERGPVRMTVKVDKGEITPAERFDLTVEVSGEEGVDVEIPWFGESFTDFVIRDHREYPVETLDQGWRRRQEYRLDVFLSGQYTIPDMTVTFTDRRAGGDPRADAKVTVSGFAVMVKPQLEGEIDQSMFRDIKGPVQLPPGRVREWALWAAGGIAVAVGSTVLAVWVLRRRDLEAQETVMLPHEWAFNQLQSLIDEQLVERGLVTDFYFRLSTIVRQYIERRFDLMAPERTTEEFMWEEQRSSKLPDGYRTMAYRFLQACDMVKFARHTPQEEEIVKAINSARDFVSRSAEDEAHQVTAA